MTIGSDVIIAGTGVALFGIAALTLVARPLRELGFRRWIVVAVGVVTVLLFFAMTWYRTRSVVLSLGTGVLFAIGAILGSRKPGLLEALLDLLGKRQGLFIALASLFGLHKNDAHETPATE